MFCAIYHYTQVTEAYGDRNEGGKGMNKTGYDQQDFSKTWYVPRPENKTAKGEASAHAHI